MRLLRTIGYIGMAAVSLHAAGQEQPRAELRWAEDGTLRVEWTETVGRKLRSEYSEWLTPMLCGDTDTLRLGHAVVRGRLNRKRLARALTLDGRGGKEAVTAFKESELQPGDTLVWSRTVNRAPWMERGRLTFCVEREKEGCCNVETLPTTCMAETAWVPPFVPSLTPLTDNSGRAGELEQQYPILRHISRYEPSRRPMLFIHFPLDKHDVRRDFRDNARRLDEIVQVTSEILADSISHVRLIQIIGTASPEGPLKHNKELAQHRVEALKSYLQLRVDVPDSLFEVINGGEAWPELRARIATDNVPYQKELLDIIDHTEDVNLREARMKTLAGGKAYDYLRRHVLQDQRYSGYVQIYYDYEPDTVPPVVNRAIELIREGRAGEALRLAETVKHDARSWNTLATALYLCGRNKEADDYYRRAADRHDTDAPHNREQMEQREAQKALLP